MACLKVTLWLVGAGIAAAQGTSTPLTLDRAVREAVEHNLDLLTQRFSLSIAEARIVQAGLRPNPVFSAGPDYQDLLRRRFTSQNSAGPPEIQARTDYIIEGGGKRARRLELARATLSVEQLRLANAVRQLTFDVQSAFVDVLAAGESLQLARENLKSFEGIVEVNRARVNSGDLAKVELMRSQVAARQFQNSVQQAELRLRTARNRLALLVGRPATAGEIGASGPLRRDDRALRVEDIRARALDGRPDLLSARREQLRSQSDVRLQTAQGKIDYTLSALYHHQYSYSNGRAFGVQVAFPLPMFNRNQGEIERARQEERQATARIRALEATISTEAENAYQQYLTARTLVENIETSMLEPAREVRQTMEYSYRRGEASLVEFLDAQRAFNETAQSYQDARAEYARSLYLIESVTGRALDAAGKGEKP